MVIPFEEKDEKLKVTRELFSDGKDAARPPVELAQENHSEEMPCDSFLQNEIEGNTEFSSCPIYTAAPLVKAKRMWLSNSLFFIIATLPVLTFLTVLASDPAAIPFLKAEYFDGKTPKAIEDVTKAYNVRHDLDILPERARIYHLLGNHPDEKADYLVLLRNKVPLKEVRPYEAAAEVLVEEKGATKEALTYLQKAMELSRPTSRLFGILNLKGWLPYSQYDSYDLRRLYLELLFCGDQSTIQALAKLKPEGSGLIAADSLFLPALAARELGDDKECRRKLALIDHDHWEFFEDISFGANTHCFKALSQLDIGRVEAAVSEIEQYSSKTHEDSRLNKSLVDLISAWILYSQGKYSEAYGRSARADKVGSLDWDGISASQVCAANRLLRSKILLKLGRDSEAHKELAAYQKSGCLGTSFIPKIYRNWIVEAQTH